MDIEQVLHDYRKGDADKRLSLFLYYREHRDAFGVIDDQEHRPAEPAVRRGAMNAAGALFMNGIAHSIAAGRRGLSRMRGVLGRYSLVLLKLSFLIGAATDGLAVVPMMHPAVGAALFGANAARLGVEYRYAMAIGASLMAGWTMLLLWGYRKPVERRGVLVITLFPAITGIVAATVYGMTHQVILLNRVIPLLIHLGLLSALMVVSVVLSSGREADASSA